MLQTLTVGDTSRVRNLPENSSGKFRNSRTINDLRTKDKFRFSITKLEETFLCEERDQKLVKVKTFGNLPDECKF